MPSLFLTLVENADMTVVTADGKLLKTLEGTPYAHLAYFLSDASSLMPITDR